MFQMAGQFCLEHEPRLHLRMVCVSVLQLLESHLSVQLLVQGHEHLTQTTSGMRPEPPESHHAVRRLRSVGSRDGLTRFGRRRLDRDETGLDFGVVELVQGLTQFRFNTQGRQAGLGSAVLG
jgi:hypothetical protein